LGLENNYASIPLVFFLFAVFCAHWAQNTGRNAWLWFFLGLAFAPITGLALLARNSDDLRESKRILGD
jgi:hypothetical protein